MKNNKILIINDIHLTDSPIESYRWDIFNKVEELIKEKKCTDLFILGDLFDKKDKHTSILVNRLVDILKHLSHKVPITILQGNHDYRVDPKNAFLRFLDKIENIKWIDKPEFIARFNSYFLPHSRHPEDDWKTIKSSFEGFTIDFIFMHQSVIGSKTSDYYELTEGLSPSYFDNVKCPIISGDIHVPQEIGKIIYIGTQYPINFGDTYQPRLLFIDDKKLEFIELDSIKKLHIKLPIETESDIKKIKDYNLSSQDQIIVTLQLSNSQLSEWSTLKVLVKEYCKELGIYLHDIRLEKLEQDKQITELKELHKHRLSSIDIFEKYVELEKLDEEVIKIGKELLV